jgi:predicted RNA-binding protein with PUA-like domain
MKFQKSSTFLSKEISKDFQKGFRNYSKRNFFKNFKKVSKVFFLKYLSNNFQQIFKKLSSKTNV